MQRLLYLTMLFTLLIVVTGCTLPGSPLSGGMVAVTPLPKAASGQSTPTATTVAAAIADSRTPRQATPTPLDLQLTQGSAAAIAAATDTVLRPTPRVQIIFDESPAPLKFSEFYDGFDIRNGLKLSDKLVSLDGQQVVIEGYMAPPLKPELDFFVLTRVRMAYCPFCSTAADWPDDIAVVYLTKGTVLASVAPLRVTGRLEVGISVDPETGLVSLVRLYADKMEALS